MTARWLAAALCLLAAGCSCGRVRPLAHTGGESTASTATSAASTAAGTSGASTSSSSTAGSSSTSTSSGSTGSTSTASTGSTGSGSTGSTASTGSTGGSSTGGTTGYGLPVCAPPTSGTTGGACVRQPPPPGLCDTDSNCWQYPTPTGEHLIRLWATASDDVWAVTFSGWAHVLHWDGAAWSFVPIPPSVDSWLGGVWASGPNDVWFPSMDPIGGLVHWDGATFTQYPIKGLTILPPQLLTVWGFGPRDVWAGGVDGTIVHWDGSELRGMIQLGGSGDEVDALWGSAPDDLWASGGNRQFRAGFLYHWDGASWTPGFAQANARFVALWGRAKDDVYAAEETGELFHWNGGVWSAVSTGVPLNGVNTIAGDASEVWVGGSPLALLRGVGSTWAAPTYAAAPREMESLAVLGPADGWGVGQGQILRLGLAGWSSYTEDRYGPGFQAVRGGAADDVWFVGLAGRTGRWDGAGLTFYETGGTEDLRDVWPLGPSLAYAVGDAGALYRWDGRAWSREPVPTSANLLAVWARGPSEVWVVGEGGTVLLGDGATWRLLPPPPGQPNLHAIDGLGPCDVWVVGPSGTLFRWDGAGFSSMPVPSPGELYAVRAFADDDVWVGGEGSAALHWDGQAWTSYSTCDVWGCFPTVGAFLGQPGSLKLAAKDAGGILMSWDGTAWSWIPPGAYAEGSFGAAGAWQDCAGDIWFAGIHGVVRHYP